MLFKEDMIARKEHQAVRENAGWYRWTHDLVDVKGEDAGVFLDKLFVGAVAAAPVGKTKYTTMLNEDGKIIDDTIVMHMGENHFWVSTLYAPQFLKWADAHRSGEDVHCEDHSQAIDMYAVQGPNSGKIMNALVKAPVDDLKRFAIADNEIDGISVKVHRSGFTGELGYEIYCEIADTDAVAEAIRAACAKFDAPEITTLEVYVRSLPVEKGFALRQDMYGLSPFACGLGWSVKFDKDFIGKEAALARKEHPKYRMVGLEFSRESTEDISIWERVYWYGVEVGRCAQTIYGYTVDKNIGFATVRADVPDGAELTVGCNDSPAVVVNKVFC